MRGRERRADLVKIVRSALTNYCADPSTYDPPGWVLDAMQLAFDMGALDERMASLRAPRVKSCHPGDRCTYWPQCEACGPARL